jgi:hypothetical protein
MGARSGHNRSTLLTIGIDSMRASFFQIFRLVCFRSLSQHDFHSVVLVSARSGNHCVAHNAVEEDSSEFAPMNFWLG